MACRDLKTTIGEVLLCRIADRPSAPDLADLREPDPPVSPLSATKIHRSRRFFPREWPERASHAKPRFPEEITADGSSFRAPPVPDVRPGDRRRALRPQRHPAQSVPDDAEPVPPFSLTPIRVAFPITALREGAPSPAAMQARASSLERQFPQRLDRLLCPRRPHPPIVGFMTTQIDHRLPEL